MRSFTFSGYSKYRYLIALLVKEILLQFSDRQILPQLPEGDVIVEPSQFLHILIELLSSRSLGDARRLLVLLPEHPFDANRQLSGQGLGVVLLLILRSSRGRVAAFIMRDRRF